MCASSQNPRRRKRITKNERISSRRAAKFPINYRDGRIDIPGVDSWHSYWREPYYLMLTVPWWIFFLLTAIAYCGVNALFALGYLLGGDCIAHADSGSFSDAFFFSVQTLASLGYGAMYPNTFYADILVTIEAWVGIISIAVMTGLVFSKFSRPTARVIFSKVAIVNAHNGIPQLS
ncbi:ion channel [Pleurocapsa sp. FMAR1]|uniref:ion channel n=1 Tax=Pleurocapsa sp. FMAR1 TaxID=3040204 RepID=UPI0029C7C484|nr:ion channel [Pleurocapsa sp. FMAR1]